ncbi:TrkH family potassium uptake protein [Methylothermus subterraneus]
MAGLLGRVGLVLAALTAVPMLVALAGGFWSAGLRYGLVIAALVSACWPLARLPLPADLRSNEGLAVTALAFLLAPPIMAYPLSAAGIGYAAALFEAVSAVTTCGLTVLPTVADKPFDFLFARAWMQWYGGLGFVALLPLWLEPGPLSRQLLGLEGESAPLTSAWIYTRRIVAVYLFLTAFGFLWLWLLGGDPFAALVHVLAAVSTGGFSSLDGGLLELGKPFAGGVIAVSVLGALPFAAYLSKPWRDLQVQTLIVFGLALGGAIAAVLVWQQGLDFEQALFHGLLTAFSAQTTAGFSTLATDSLPPVALGLLLGAMLCGGGVGSTAGGVKILRGLLVFAALRRQLRRLALPPHAWMPWQLGKLSLDEALVCRAQVLLFLYWLTAFGSWLPFLALGYDPLRSLFEVVSALGTVGLSAGIARPDLPGGLQFVLELDMWLGRVEVFAALALLHPATWRAR